MQADINIIQQIDMNQQVGILASEGLIIALPPLYRDFSTSGKHYVKNYGLTCIGILVIIIIFFIVISIPSTIFWISISSDYPWVWLSIILFQVGPLTVFLIIFIWLYKHRDDETGEDDLIPVERP